jgi:hypothetical protein
MVPLPSLWLPIVVSAVFVFIASSVIHMVLGYHRADWRPVPKDTAMQDALRPFELAPGDYMLPYAGSMKEMGSPEFKQKLERGPVLTMTVFPGGSRGMGMQLAQWFLFCLLVSAFAAFVAGRAQDNGAHYRAVFRFAAVTAFAGYALAHIPASIWYKRNWGATLRSVFDGLVYAGLTGGTFGWLWPE